MADTLFDLIRRLSRQTAENIDSDILGLITGPLQMADSLDQFVVADLPTGIFLPNQIGSLKSETDCSEATPMHENA